MESLLRAERKRICLENGNLISLILNKSSHLEGMALTPQRESTRHRRVEFIFEVSGIYRKNLDAIFSCFSPPFSHLCKSFFLFINIIVKLIDSRRLIHFFPLSVVIPHTLKVSRDLYDE